jgi:polar amino acid transport system substrate-binding protein
MVKTMLKSLFITVIAVALTMNVMGQKQIEKIKKSGVLKVGMTGAQPPFSMKAKDGSIIGYDADMAQMLASSMDVELKIVQIPFSELLNSLEKGEIDIIMSGMTITLERNMRAAFVGPYVISGKSILTKSPDYSKADESSDLNENTLTLVTLKGSTSEDYVMEEMPDSKLVLVEDYEKGVQMLIDGTADIMVADYPICAYEALVHPEKGLITIAEPLTIEPIGVAVSPHDPLLLNLVENYMTALTVIGVLDSLEKKWFESSEWLSEVE